MSTEQPFFTKQNTHLRQATPADELLHQVPPDLLGIDTVTETQYFGFCVPEVRIHGFCYLWHHPNLKLVSGGLFVHKGDKRSTPHSELCDYRTFMSDAALKHDLHDYRLDNGYGVKIVEPLKRHHVSYRDEKRQNIVALDYEALIPPVMFGDGTHLEAPVKVTGELVLRGERFAVDCYSMRDRSWAKPRPEDVLPLPGVSWMQGVFNDDFAFCCTVLDQASGNPKLVGTSLALPEEKTLNGGWIYRDGKVGWLTRARKRVARQPDGMTTSIDLELTDEFGRTIQVAGKTVTSVGFQPWTNIFMPVMLMCWECEGLVAYGDSQEGLWNDYLNLPEAG